MTPRRSVESGRAVGEPGRVFSPRRSDLSELLGRAPAVGDPQNITVIEGCQWASPT